MTIINKVLVVDDDPLQRIYVRRILENKYNVEIAEDGEMALAILPLFRPSVVLLDIDMPKMDGLTACAKIRADPSFGFIKIIIVSGRVTLEDRIKGYQVGADDYLAKPVDEAELLAKVGIMMRLKQAEEVDRLKSTVLGLLSHETGTPLNGIMLACRIIQDKYSDDDELLRLVEIIEQSGERLGDFVDKAKLLCRLKSGVELRLSMGMLAAHLQMAVTKGIELAGNKNISFEVDVPEDMFLEADWQLMDRVFRILIENAVKFSKHDGNVLVRAEKGGNFCTIEIVDDGKGVGPEWVDNVFSEFAIPDLMAHQQGTGLSLAIALRIIKLHGGQVVAANRDEGGAVFTITLPSVKVAGNAATSSSSGRGECDAFSCG